MDSNWREWPGSDGTLGDFEQEQKAKRQPTMTSRQRSACIMCQGLANDMEVGGTVAERWTAAALRLVANATAAGYVGEMAEAMRVWCAEWEQNDTKG